MPKTEKELDKSFNIRVSDDIKKKWEKYSKEHNFASVSNMIRSTVNKTIDGILTPSYQNTEILERMKVLEQENKDLLKSQNDILKIIAQKSGIQTNNKSSEYQKELILNLLKEKPRNEKELSKLLGITDVDIMVLLNELLEMSLIKRSEKAKTKFETVI